MRLLFALEIIFSICLLQIWIYDIPQKLNKIRYVIYKKICYKTHVRKMYIKLIFYKIFIIILLYYIYFIYIYTHTHTRTHTHTHTHTLYIFKLSYLQRIYLTAANKLHAWAVHVMCIPSTPITIFIPTITTMVEKQKIGRK